MKLQMVTRGDGRQRCLRDVLAQGPCRDPEEEQGRAGHGWMGWQNQGGSGSCQGTGEAEQMGEAIWGGEGGMLPRKLKEAPDRETACSEQLRVLYSFSLFGFGWFCLFVCFLWFFGKREM